jgi:hypothetical protein
MQRRRAITERPFAVSALACLVLGVLAGCGENRRENKAPPGASGTQPGDDAGWIDLEIAPPGHDAATPSRMGSMASSAPDALGLDPQAQQDAPAPVADAAPPSTPPSPAADALAPTAADAPAPAAPPDAAPTVSPPDAAPTPDARPQPPPECTTSQECADGNPCTMDICAAGLCMYAPAPAGTACRPAAGACDLPESCDGRSLVCPADGKAAAGTVCRRAEGACDRAEACDGTSAACPADAPAAAGTICRPAAGPCDVAETCDGQTRTCPSDDLKAAPGTVCGRASGPCERAGQCDGATNGCPANTLAERGTVCAKADPARGCDADDLCDGETPTCRPRLAEPGTLCRPSKGACDPEEVCTGRSADCPADELMPAETICRAAPLSQACSAPERCTGKTPECPGDGHLAPDPTAVAARICRVAYACPAGKGDCNVDDGLACEADLTSLGQCGRCGTSCKGVFLSDNQTRREADLCDGFACGWKGCPLTPVPAGHYGDSAACYVCPAGTSNPTPGQRAPTACQVCPAGRFAGTGATACQTCPAGHSTGGRPGQASCRICPAGTYAQAGDADCTPCPAGTFAPQAGASACTPCPLNTYAPDPGWSSCAACPTGQRTCVTGATACTSLFCGIVVQPRL